MPFYQFTVPSDSPSSELKAEIADAATKVPSPKFLLGAYL
jgi:phenylpyruvate tautomerase PptA (4-oxalocrotonate tautomerase family)